MLRQTLVVLTSGPGLASFSSTTLSVTSWNLQDLINLLNPYELKNQLNPYDLSWVCIGRNPYDLSWVCI